MHEYKSSFKQPPKKYQPKGLTILYEDIDIIVVDKEERLLTIGTDSEKEKTAHFLLNDYVKKGNPRSRQRIYIVHRLDRDTSGILVFAKSEKAKQFLQEQWHEFSKKYIAVVHGVPEKHEDVISSYLAENKAHRMYSTHDTEEGKLAKTGYKVVKDTGNLSLLEISLLTGRKNQIRVHLAEMGHPVVGDKIYGKSTKGIKRLALHSATLTIIHPFSKKEMTFKTDIPRYFRILLKNKEL